MCGDLRCGFNKPRQIMSRMINKAFAPNLTNDEIHVGLGYTAKQLREALLKTSPWDEATTIDKWNTKVMLGSGAKGGTKFKALNQSVLTQTANALQDMHRLVRRTRVKRRAS